MKILEVRPITGLSGVARADANMRLAVLEDRLQAAWSTSAITFAEATREAQMHGVPLGEVMGRVLTLRAALIGAEGAMLSDAFESQLVQLERDAWWSMPAWGRVHAVTRMRAAFVAGGVVLAGAAGLYIWRSR